jgi:hypothetical protein
VNNRVIFNLKREEIRDVRLRANWRRSFQLSDPTPLAVRSALNLQAIFVDMGLDSTVDPTAQNRSQLCRFEGGAWAVLSGYGPGPTNFCPALDVSKFALSGAELIGYLGAGTVLAQIPTRAEILEIAWEQDGMVKTVAFQVPLQSKPLLLALRGAVSKENRRPVKGRLRLRNDDLRAMRMS